MLQVAIVGGGISGLAAAYFLEQRADQASLDLEITLIERNDRLGGVISSEHADGFLIEGGPDSFLTQKPAAMDLCRQLGLEDHLIPSNDQQRKTFILQGGELMELPEGLMFMLPSKIGPILRSRLFSLSGKIRLALSPLISPPPLEDDVSVADFVSQRLGREALERLAEPLLSAVYGADVNNLSARVVLQRMIEMEKKHGSLWKAVRAAQRASATPAGARAGKPPASLFVTLRGGLGELIGALRQKLRRTQFVTGTEITTIARSEQDFQVLAGDGEAAAAAVIVATPAHAAASVLHSLDAPLADLLAGIPYHSTMTVNLGYEEAGFGRALDGFGFVVPRGEGKRMVACTWVTSKYAGRSPAGRLLLRCFLGGARDQAVMEENDASILDILRRELAEIMGVRAEPSFVRIHRWQRAMPQYPVGHPGRIEEIVRRTAAHPGLYLAGNGYKGIGIPDCIDSASAAATAAVEYLQRAP